MLESRYAHASSAFPCCTVTGVPLVKASHVARTGAQWARTAGGRQHREVGLTIRGEHGPRTGLAACYSLLVQGRHRQTGGAQGPARAHGLWSSQSLLLICHGVLLCCGSLLRGSGEAWVGTGTLCLLEQQP